MKLTDELEGFIGPIISVCRAQFPRKCSNCGLEFADFGDFVSKTRPIGAPQLPYTKDDPFGAISYVNSTCGSTIVLKCEDAAAHERLSQAIALEARLSGRAAKDILLDIRAEVRRRALREVD